MKAVDILKVLVMMTLGASLWIAWASIAEETTSQSERELRVMTYNIRYKSMDDRVERDGRTHPWDGRKQLVPAQTVQ